MKTLNDYIGAVRLACGDPAGTSHMALGFTPLMHALNWSASEIAKRTHLLQNEHTENAVVGTMEYGISDDLDYYLDDINCTHDGIPLKRLSYQQLMTIHGLNVSNNVVSNGTPLYYAFREGDLVVFPPPDTVGTNNIVLNYYADAQPMTAGDHVAFYGSVAISTSERSLIFAEEGVTIGGEMRTWKAMGNTEKYREARAEFEAAIASINQGMGDIPAEDVQWFEETE